ncbi:50S ribosomal protein L9 [candidate division NPL-UPA2 bacterium]|nr:50S ribosomal protein L9 [candidate division NPL-UPA2 bacterium]
MKIMLRENQGRLGKRGEVVEVAPGYARNFLLPRGFAFEATPKNMKLFEEEKKIEVIRKRKEEDEVKELSRRLSKVSCTIAVETGEDEKLYGSVTSLDIAEALAREGIEVDKRKIILEEPIKSPGIYHIPVKFHPQVTAEVKVWVVKK